MSKRFLPSSPGLYWAQLFDGEEVELALLRVKLYQDATIKDGVIVEHVEKQGWQFEMPALANNVIVSPVQMRYREFYGLTGDQQPQVKIRWMGPLRRPSFKEWAE
ncbi:hypothetical protein FA341_14975 [Pseudomonas aeruginosa]|uniref:Uncharacterized protein n=2 Tax=Pseudomonas aeruginosa TaxID=287 RepID=A0A6C0L1A0_PSEAI|nr:MULTISPECIES: hypothetical protein [Pseudomonas aeruginosa group]EIU2642905.1 hypothetical protein [Pseudomonas aeruginosa]EIU9543917.1 hypothetical protein [Pseudomonas aeruginosa]EIU9551352.1 hypothetical protein [Pseudomonas aeruginosa]EJY6032796.1 hypothetical protein [Pseudomonas aeruginosa]EKC7897022.1 hypothetical protein [Pseudomonas aeruginosa]